MSAMPQSRVVVNAMFRVARRFGLALALLMLAPAQKLLAAGPTLFTDATSLDLVIEVPMKTLLGEAKQKPVLPGLVHYPDANGSAVSVPIEITTRGRSRLEFCTFPPLSISFPEQQQPPALFAGQHKLKIATQCRKGSKYADYLEQELGIYRAYNQLTDHSFRVRKLNVTYRDSAGKRKDESHPAFFIESDDEVAARLGLEVIESPTTQLNQLDARQTSILGLFQYLIGNTDWDITKGPGSESCCHNGKLVGPAGSGENWVVVPYDFDQAGLINTEYAMPSPALGIRSVRTRLYRGECRFNAQLAATIALFNEKRAGVANALITESLTSGTRKSAQKYLDAFYMTINDPAKLEKQVTSACQKG